MKNEKYRYWYGKDGQLETYWHKVFTFGEIESGMPMEELNDNPLLKNYSIIGRDAFTGFVADGNIEVFDNDKLEAYYSGSEQKYINYIGWSESEYGWWFANAPLWAWEDVKVIGNRYTEK